MAKCFVSENALWTGNNVSLPPEKKSGADLRLPIEHWKFLRSIAAWRRETGGRTTWRRKKNGSGLLEAAACLAQLPGRAAILLHLGHSKTVRKI